MTPGAVRWFGITLSTVAGFVDAVGFLTLGGSYVAFMSGNSTLIGTGLAEQAPAATAVALGLVLCFVLGVVAGTLVGGSLQRQRPAVLLLLVAAGLAGAAGLDQAGLAVPGTMILAASMGAVNTVFNRNGGPPIGLTYMTGTLVRIGQRLAEALRGGPWGAVAPDALLWGGMILGAGLGTLCFHRLGVLTLWLGVAAVLGMAMTARTLVARTPSRGAA